MAGVWIDTFHYDGTNEEGAAEVNVANCNGRVYTDDELKLIIADIGALPTKSLSRSTIAILTELQCKLECGLELL